MQSSHSYDCSGWSAKDSSWFEADLAYAIRLNFRS